MPGKSGIVIALAIPQLPLTSQTQGFNLIELANAGG